MPTLHTTGADPLIAVDVEPQLLGDLVRRQLADRGVAVSGPEQRPDHVTVALVGGGRRVEVDADIVVRLDELHADLPARAVIEIPEPDTPRVAMIRSAEELIDLLVELAGA